MKTILTHSIRSELATIHSLRHQKRLARTWDNRISSPFAFIPTSVRKGGISEKAAEDANLALGKFATDFLKKSLSTTSPEILERREKAKSVIAAFGYGKGHDSGWVSDAMTAKLQTRWFDISPLACNIAILDFNRQLQEIGIASDSDNSLRPLIHQCEIKSVLIDPGIVYDFSPELVEIWYLCRTLGCLSLRSARTVLLLLGQNLKVNNTGRIILVNALSDDNPGYTGSNSKLFSLKQIITNLQKGAERKVQILSTAKYQYFDKTVTALEIQ